MPPCPLDSGAVPESSEENTTDGDKTGIVRSQSERLVASCREHSAIYRDIQEKYHEAIYSTAEKVMKASQTNQMKQLKTSLDKVTSEVMHQLQEARRNEVKNLATVHRDRDELVR